VILRHDLNHLTNQCAQRGRGKRLGSPPLPHDKKHGRKKRYIRSKIYTVNQGVSQLLSRPHPPPYHYLSQHLHSIDRIMQAPHQNSFWCASRMT